MNHILWIGSTEILHDLEMLTEVEHCHDPGLPIHHQLVIHNSQNEISCIFH